MLTDWHELRWPHKMTTYAGIWRIISRIYFTVGLSCTMGNKQGIIDWYSWIRTIVDNTKIIWWSKCSFHCHSTNKLFGFESSSRTYHVHKFISPFSSSNYYFVEFSNALFSKYEIGTKSREWFIIHDAHWWRQCCVILGNSPNEPGLIWFTHGLHSF